MKIQEKKNIYIQAESKDLRDENQPMQTEITNKGSATELLT
jgi:hypothetical protein